MSGKKVTPRTLITDFLGSNVPEQSALRPSRHRTSRHQSGPGGTTKTSRQQSKLASHEKRSMHLSLLDETTPRTLVSDFMNDTKTTEPTRKRPQLERSPEEPSRKSPRLNTTEPVLRRSPRGSPTTQQSSPRRRRSVNSSLLKKTVVRNFINSPKQRKLKDMTPRTMVTNFLMGDTPEQTPLVAHHKGAKPTPDTSTLHTSTSFNINVSPSEESLLDWQQKYKRPGVVGKTRGEHQGSSQHGAAHQGAASVHEKLSQFSQQLSPNDDDDEENEDGGAGEEPEEETAGYQGNKSNMSGNLSNLSVMSSGDIDGSYLSLPSSQLSQKSTRGNRSRAVQEITSAAIQQGIGDLLQQTTEEELSSRIMHTLEQIEEGEEEEEGEDEGTLTELEQRQKHTAENRREILADRSQNLPSDTQGSDTSKWQVSGAGTEEEVVDGDEAVDEGNVSHVGVGDNEDVDARIENSVEEEDDEQEEVEQGQEEDKENEEIVPPSDNEIESEDEIPADLQAPSGGGHVDRQAPSRGPAEFIKNVSSADSPGQEGNRTSLTEQGTPQTGFTSQMSTPGSTAQTPSIMEGYDRLRTPVMVQSTLAFKGRSLTAAFPTPNVPATSSTSLQSSSTAGAAKKPRAPRKPKDTHAPVRIPTVNTRSMFTHFCGKRVSKDAIAEIEKVADKFWDRAAEDLFAFAEHAKRKFTLSEADVELLMKRQGFVTDKCSMYTLVEKYLPLEQRQEIIPCARANGNVYPPN